MNDDGKFPSLLWLAGGVPGAVAYWFGTAKAIDKRVEQQRGKINAAAKLAVWGGSAWLLYKLYQATR